MFGGMMGTRAGPVNAMPGALDGRDMQKAGLLQRAGMEVAIHIDPAECAFYGIDLAVLIPIQLLEMIMGEIQGLRMEDTRRLCGRTWIIALRILEHAVVNQIGPRLDNGLRDGFLRDLHRSMAFPPGRR